MVFVNAIPSSTLCTTKDGAQGSPIFFHCVLECLTVLCFEKSFPQLFRSVSHHVLLKIRILQAPFPSSVLPVLLRSEVRCPVFLFKMICSKTFCGQWLNIHLVCNLFIGHNGCRVGVYKYYLYPFFSFKERQAWVPA